MTRVSAIACATALASTLSGCSDDLGGRADPDLGEEAALRLGRIHVLLDRTDGPVGARDGFSSFVEATARFAYVSGFDEEFVRARADIPLIASDVLRAGQCAPSEQLAPDAGASDADGPDGRELVLLDAGEIEVRVGSARFEVPVSLVPDLLPYMSGIEYLYLSDATSDPILALPGGDLAVRVVAQGTMADELADFTVDGLVPAPPVLQLDGDLEDDELRLRWDGDSTSRPVIITVNALQSGEPSGAEITCVFEDDGRASIDAGVLRLHGLDPLVSDGLSIQASRMSHTTFEAGEFSGAELLVESRDTLILGGT